MTDDDPLLQMRSAMERSLESLDAKTSPDGNDKEEDQAAKEARAKTRSLEEQNEDKRSFRQLREKYARWVFRYLVCYSLACAAIVVLAGSQWGGFTLPEVVLSYLVGSTAVAAIGLVLAVTHGLFKR